MQNFVLISKDGKTKVYSVGDGKEAEALLPRKVTVVKSPAACYDSLEAEPLTR